jgi:hypothetical protein
MGLNANRKTRKFIKLFHRMQIHFTHFASKEKSMTKLRIAICAIGGLIGILTPMTFAAFNDIGVGARPLGLGGAFVAMADDGNAANYNVAGLGYIDTVQVSATYAQQFKGLINYSYVGGVLPLASAGTLGASIGILSEKSEIYKERTMTVSYGKTFSPKFAIGVNLKSFGTSFNENNESVRTNLYFAKTSASAVSFDVGAMAKPVAALTLGVSAENLLPANVSISESGEDNVATNIRVGLAYSLAEIAESTQLESLREVLKSGLGLLEIAFRDGDRQIHAGAEVWLNKSIGLRAGYAVKSGVNSATSIAVGGSAKIPVSSLSLQLDYAFQILTGDFEDNTTQRISLGLIF